MHSCKWLMQWAVVVAPLAQVLRSLQHRPQVMSSAAYFTQLDHHLWREHGLVVFVIWLSNGSWPAKKGPQSGQKAASPNNCKDFVNWDAITCKHTAPGRCAQHRVRSAGTGPNSRTSPGFFKPLFQEKLNSWHQWMILKDNPTPF